MYRNEIIIIPTVAAWALQLTSSCEYFALNGESFGLRDFRPVDTF